MVLKKVDLVDDQEKSVSFFGVDIRLFYLYTWNRTEKFVSFFCPPAHQPDLIRIPNCIKLEWVYMNILQIWQILQIKMRLNLE